MKRNTTIIFAILIIILQIYLISVQPINARITLKYDEALMVEQAKNIIEGKWLGEYNCLTLVKGPITPLFIATAKILHIPFLIAQDIFYILSCILIIFVFRRLIKSNIAKLIALTLLIFNPIIYSTELCRVYRDGIYLALIMYLIAFSFGIFLNRKEKISKMIVYYIGLGVTIGAIYLCREETIWLMPYLVISTIITVIYIIKDKEVLQKKQKLMLYLVPILIFVLMTISVMLLNYKYYGVFQLNQYWGKEFKEAYGALTRILPEEEIEKVPVTSDALEKAYQISPKANELKEYFDIYINEWAICGDGELGEIQGGYFHWALIRAVESKEYYKDAKTANEFYKQMANEINNACDENKVDSLNYKRVSNVIRFDTEDIYNTILKCKDTIKYQYEMKELEVLCPKIKIERYEKIYQDIMKDFEHMSLTKGNVYKEKSRINILEKIKDIYAKINPYVFNESIVVAIIFIVLSIIMRKNSEKVIILIAIVGLYLCRIFIVTFTSLTMYTTAVNVMYLSVTYIMQIMFAIFGNIFLGQEIIEYIKKRRKDGKIINNTNTSIK